jgi:malonyl-CoA/methylmalonyl-CoA synthetase
VIADRELFAYPERMGPHFLNELRTTFADRAGRPALVYQGRAHSYADLEAAALRAAALLQSQGMRPGDRVAVWTADKLPFLIAHLGVLFGGGVSLPLNPRHTAEEMRHFLSDSEARLVAAGVEQQPVLDGLRGALPEMPTVLPDAALLAAPAAMPHPIQPKAEDACLLIYSSGTTGWPKGIVHSHANLAASLRALAACWRFTPEDRVVNVLPLFHLHGLSFATHLTLLVGGCVLLEESFHPLHTLDAIGRGTVFMAVPTIYYRFLQEPAFRDKARGWQSVRLFTCGSAPLRPDVLPELEEILGRPVINRYGMSEAHVITSLPLDGPWPRGSVGLPIDGIELAIVRDDGRPAAVGEVGMIQVRGPNLFRGYWRKPEATQRAFASGWFETGDLGQRDAAGFLTLVGRSNDLIITKGYNVYPQIVERVLNACPGVRESAVIGVPDDLSGERVVAVVVRDDPGLDEAQLRAHCAERLVDYQRPRAMIFVEQLPRNALGKVLRRQLREKFRREPRAGAGTE